MVSLYVTYGYGTRLRNKYSKVSGETTVECYDKIDKATGGKYAFVYFENDFNDQPEKYGLTEVPLQACSAYD